MLQSDVKNSPKASKIGLQVSSHRAFYSREKRPKLLPFKRQLLQHQNQVLETLVTWAKIRLKAQF